jgi:hypothetical protein
MGREPGSRAPERISYSFSVVTLISSPISIVSSSPILLTTKLSRAFSYISVCLDKLHTASKQTLPLTHCDRLRLKRITWRFVGGTVCVIAGAVIIVAFI